MEKKYRLEMTEAQMRLIADCVEDCHRFAAGQTELFNTTSICVNEHYNELADKLRELQPLVTPELPQGSSYNWSGKLCPNEYQRKFIAQSYPIYREIRHFFTLEHQMENTYSSKTPTCELGGELIKITPVGPEPEELYAVMYIDNVTNTSNIMSKHEDFSEAVEDAKKIKAKMAAFSNNTYWNEWRIGIYKMSKKEKVSGYILNADNKIEEETDDK